MLQLNRFMTRQNIIEDNELNDAEIKSVFSQLRPEIGAGEGAKYLEEDADKIIGKVRRRQLSLGQTGLISMGRWNRSSELLTESSG